jgi:hypothetical protein
VIIYFKCDFNGGFPEEISFQYLPTRVGLALISSEIKEVKGVIHTINVNSIKYSIQLTYEPMLIFNPLK